MSIFNFLKSNKSKEVAEADAYIKRIQLLSFPEGPEQAGRESAILHKLLGGKVDIKAAEYILRKTKARLIVAEDKSESYITKTIQESGKGALSQDDAKLIYRWLTGVDGSKYSEHLLKDGNKIIKINATSAIAGIGIEYEYLESKFGKRDIAWKIKERSHSEIASGHHIEAFKIITNDNIERIVYFDITSFYGKFF